MTGQQHIKYHRFSRSQVGPQVGDSPHDDSRSQYDQMPEVEYWVRNLDSREHDSFYLQLHNRKFYPDFVVKLKDGRILVVEYKGADRYSNDDSKEKRIIGDFWAKNSGGQCLFVMTNGKSFSDITSAVK